jgi:sugar phosphate isomerase/epimerase
MMKLAVTTLGCPEWTLPEIISRVKEYGYDAVELRGLGPDLDLTQSPAFNTPGAIAESKRAFADAGLEICALDSSASFATADPAEREKMLSHAKQFVDLALALDCPYVRVFGGATPEGEERSPAVARVAECLLAVGDHAAKNAGSVSVLLETHDAYSTGAQVAEVLSQAQHPNVGCLWDLHHPARHGETARQTYDAIEPYIRMTHVKDSKPGGTYCLLGEGDIPIKEMIQLLHAGGYDGYLSLEWEKRWIAALAPAEEVFPQYAKKLREYLAEL